MAENIKIKIGVDSSSIDSLIQKMGKLGGEIKTATDEGTVKKLNNELNQTEQELSSIGTVSKSVKTRLRELEDEMAEIGNVGSKEFQKLAREAGTLRDQVNNAKAATNAYSSDFPKLQLGVEAFNAIGGASQVAMGAVALLGIENENVTKSIQIMVGVQTMMNGVNSVAKALSDETLLGIKARIALEKVQVVVTRGMAAAQRVLNAVMAANPIGLIVAAIGLLVAGFIAFKKPIIDFISNWENLKMVMLALLGPIGWIIIAYQKLFGEEAKIEAKRKEAAAAEKQRAKESIARHKAKLKRIEEEKNGKVKAIDETVSALQLEKETLEAEGKSSFSVALLILEAEKEKTTGILEANRERIQSMLSYYQAELAASGQSEEAFKKSLKLRGIDVDELKRKNDEVIKANEDAVQRSENAITKLKREHKESQVSTSVSSVKEVSSAEEKAEADRLKRIADGVKAEEDFYAKLDKANQAYSDSLLSKQELEEKAVTDKYAKIIEDAVKYGEDSTKVEELQRIQLQAIKDKYDEIDENKKKEKDAKKLEDEANTKAAELELETKHREDMFSIINDSLSSIEAISQLVTSNEINRIKEKQQAGEKLSNAEKRKLKRDIAMQKAFAVAKIAIDTAMSLTSAIAGATASAAATGPGAVAFTPIFIASQIATVLGAVASAAAILGAPTPSIGGSVADTATAATDGGGSRQPTQTPSFNLFGQPNDGSEGGASDSDSKNRTQTIRAVVSWSDIDSITKSNLDVENEMTL